MTRIRLLLIGAATALTLFAVPAMASASTGYTISQGQAQRLTLQAAEDHYAGNDVDARGATCRPQYVSKPSSYWKRYNWHRWSCSWWGYDGDHDGVYGAFMIAGNTDQRYSYKAIYGGMRWE